MCVTREHIVLQKQMPDEEVFRGHAGHLARQNLWKHPLRVRLIELGRASLDRPRRAQGARPFAKRGSVSEEVEGWADSRIEHWIRAASTEELDSRLRTEDLASGVRHPVPRDSMI